jgi:hypothetical protein
MSNQEFEQHLTAAQKGYNNQRQLPIPNSGDRAFCPLCKKPIPIDIDYEYKDAMGNSIDDFKYRMLSQTPGAATKTPVAWRYRGYGNFDNLKCAAKWANQVIDSLKKKEAAK